MTLYTHPKLQCNYNHVSQSLFFLFYFFKFNLNLFYRPDFISISACLLTVPHARTPPLLHKVTPPHPHSSPYQTSPLPGAFSLLMVSYAFSDWTRPSSPLLYICWGLIYNGVYCLVGVPVSEGTRGPGTLRKLVLLQGCPTLYLLAFP